MKREFNVRSGQPESFKVLADFLINRGVVDRASKADFLEINGGAFIAATLLQPRAITLTALVWVVGQ